jgi:hypothetical protein
MISHEKRTGCEKRKLCVGMNENPALPQSRCIFEETMGRASFLALTVPNERVQVFGEGRTFDVLSTGV